MNTYRVFARANVFYDPPRVFLNSIPKAGTHLLNNILDEMPGIQNSGIHIKKYEVNTLSKSPLNNADFEFDNNAFKSIAGRVNDGQFFTAHLPAADALLASLDALDVRSIMLVRHPADIITSEMHYILGLRRHYLHRAFHSEIPNNTARLMTLIQGRVFQNGAIVRPLRDRIEEFLPWVVNPNTFTLRYEDLVGGESGGDDDVRLARVTQLLNYLDRYTSKADVGEVISRSRKRRSFTLRKGKVGDSGASLTSEHWAAFNEQVRDLLPPLGYR
jgi:hypothetical protein